MPLSVDNKFAVLALFYLWPYSRIFTSIYDLYTPGSKWQKSKSNDDNITFLESYGFSSVFSILKSESDRFVSLLLLLLLFMLILSGYIDGTFSASFEYFPSPQII